MDVGLEAMIIIILILIIIYLLYLSNYNRLLLKVKSTYDNNDYYVQDSNYSLLAANLIAQIRERINTLVEHLGKIYPNDERTILLKKNYNENSIKEGIEDPRYTSYSVNKGEEIILCLTKIREQVQVQEQVQEQEQEQEQEPDNNLMDINTMMFVVLHELGHLSSVSVGHTTEFWNNFKWILEESINIGIYMRQDFDTKPVEYCGMSITSTPLDDINTTNFNINKGENLEFDTNAGKLIEAFILDYNYLK